MDNFSITTILEIDRVIKNKFLGGVASEDMGFSRIGHIIMPESKRVR
jgi:hypothetical protein